MDSYRVFVSYSHEDKELVQRIVHLLEDEDHRLMPLWDQDFEYGRGFDEQIKALIAHAHVFLPVLTTAASKRGWVHQEIGYAMALRVPVLPVFYGSSPGEMLTMLHGIRLENDADLAKKLSRSVFDGLVAQAARPLYECANQPEERSELLAEYANSVAMLRSGRSRGLVRQRGSPGTFAIPNRNDDHPAWRARDPSARDSKKRVEGLLGERKALQRHATEAGCRLIVNPSMDYDKDYGPGTTCIRLQTLVEFLQDETLPREKVEIVLDSNRELVHSMTLVGDWFLAEAVQGTTHGYRQTIFTRHAASVRRAIEKFDDRFHDLLQEAGTPAASSRAVAIQQLQEQMAHLARRQ